MPAVRKPAELHELHGSKPHDRSPDLSHVPSGRPKFPRDLDSSLRPVFKRVCKLLQDRRTLTAADGELIRLYCFQYDRHTRNVALLREEGEICSYTRLDSNGQPHEMVKPNYRVKVVTDAERQMAAILNQLGFSPTAKDRARPTGKREEERKLDPMEQFLERKPMEIVPAKVVQIAPPEELDEPD